MVEVIEKKKKKRKNERMNERNKNLRCVINVKGTNYRYNYVIPVIAFSDQGIKAISVNNYQNLPFKTRLLMFWISKGGLHLKSSSPPFS